MITLRSMRGEPTPYFAIADRFALMLKPPAEVAVHDPDIDRFLHRASAFSRRRPGNPVCMIGPYGQPMSALAEVCPETGPVDQVPVNGS